MNKPLTKEQRAEIRAEINNLRKFHDTEVSLGVKYLLGRCLKVLDSHALADEALDLATVSWRRPTPATACD